MVVLRPAQAALKQFGTVQRSKVREVQTGGSGGLWYLEEVGSRTDFSEHFERESNLPHKSYF